MRDEQYAPFTDPSRRRPGPREIRYLLELTLAYSNGLQDLVIEDAMHERPDILDRYTALLDHLRSLVAPGEGGLKAIEDECRALLGER